MTYYGLVSKGRKYALVRVDRIDGRRVQTETGDVFTTQREAMAALVAHQRSIGALPPEKAA